MQGAWRHKTLTNKSLNIEMVENENLNELWHQLYKLRNCMEMM